MPAMDPGSQGLTKREYMATQILSGMCANVNAHPRKANRVTEALDLTDMLLSALNEPKPETG